MYVTACFHDVGGVDEKNIIWLQALKFSSWTSLNRSFDDRDTMQIARSQQAFEAARIWFDAG